MPFAPAVTVPVRGRVAALSGLRAPLMLSVLADHAGLTDQPGGAQASVEVFFVLSGFLVTSVLLSDVVRRGRLSLRRFLARRALRLLPVVVVVVVSVDIFFAIVPVHASRDLAGQSLAALTLTMDYFQAHRIGYGLVIGHMWSLSVEEKFYLIWPAFMLVLVTGRATALRVQAVALGLCITAVLAAAWLDLQWVGDRPFTPAYYRADTRAAGLLVGSALALGMSVAPRIGTLLRPRAVGAVALAALVVMEAHPLVLGSTGREQAVLGFPLTDVAAAALIGHLAVTARGPAARLLGQRTVARIGDLSYAFYLWHLPVLVLLVERWQQGAWVTTLVGGAASLLLAEATFLLVERPLRPVMRRMGGRPAGAPRVAAPGPSLQAGLVD